MAIASVGATGCDLMFGVTPRGDAAGVTDATGDAMPMPTPSTWDHMDAGWAHTCAIAGETRALWCWGENTVGQLGDTTQQVRSRPVPVASDLRWRMVSAGANHTCALTEDDLLWCWGGNGQGQLGTGDRTNSYVPAPVMPSKAWAQIEAGRDSTCGVTRDGRLWCWGLGADGRLGMGSDLSDRLAPTQVGGDTDWTAVSVQGQHTCGLRGTTLLCWGRGNEGQTTHASSTITPTMVTDPNLATVAAVDVGDGFTCARHTDGGVWCWGDDGVGQLGNGPAGSSRVPARLPFTWVALAVGTSSACAVRSSDRGLWCWGSGLHGRLGLPANDATLAPTEVDASASWAEVTIDNAHACVRSSTGELRCAGAAWRGQLGDGAGPAFTPQRVILPGPNQVSIGREHACAGTDAGVRCWGRGVDGQLAQADLLDRQAPAPLRADGATVALDAHVAAGRRHTCAAASGTVWCWGDNSEGALGVGSTDPRIGPQLVPALAASGLTAAGHTCAVRTTDKYVVCWGRGDEGQLGRGDRTDSGTPGSVPTWAAQSLLVTTGAGHTCATILNGNTACWGRNQFGQLGADNLTDYVSSVAPSGDHRFAQLGAGDDHTCGVDTGGALWCWGLGDRGQLGLGDRGNRQVPTAVPTPAGVTRWLDVSAGARHTCARAQGANLSEATLYCWGDGADGQLGLGEAITQALVPTRVPSTAFITALAAGANTTCAIDTSRQLWCWGGDAYGQRGTDTAWRAVLTAIAP